MAARAVGFGLPLAVMMAWVLARYRFPGRPVLNALVHLPLVLPPVVTGWLLLIIFGIRGPIGSLLLDWFGVRLVFTTAGASLACAVMTFPVMVRAIRLSLEMADPGLEQAARALGARRFDRLFNVTLPLASPGILVGGIVAYATCLGEFGAVITFAANIPGQTQTLPLAIYAALQVPGGEAKAARTVAGVTDARADRAAAVGVARQTTERNAGSMSLSVRLRHRFPSVQMDMAFEVPTPGVTVLFGPSGSGKSTIISAAAGLLRPDECRIAVDGQVLADTASGIWLPPERRRMGLVFQDARLFPHMSVATNLRFGLRRAAAGPVQFDEVVELLGIAGLMARRPHTLSGGERQRVAIGRALLAQPHLLLMDEPLASLDTLRKSEIMPYLTRLKTALKLPILYVTHALDEVAQLADSVVLIEAGRVIGSGPLSEIVARGDLPLAQRDDAGALLLCRVVEHDVGRELSLLEGGGATFWVPLLDAPLDAERRLRIPAREVILAGRPPDAISLHNIIPGEVRRITGDTARRSVLVEIALPGGGALISRVTSDAIVRLALSSGSPVLALIKSTSIEVLEN